MQFLMYDLLANLSTPLAIARPIRNPSTLRAPQRPADTAAPPSTAHSATSVSLCSPYLPLGETGPSRGGQKAHVPRPRFQREIGPNIIAVQAGYAPQMAC